MKKGLFFALCVVLFLSVVTRIRRSYAITFKEYSRQVEEAEKLQARTEALALKKQPRKQTYREFSEEVGFSLPEQHVSRVKEEVLEYPSALPVVQSSLEGAFPSLQAIQEKLQPAFYLQEVASIQDAYDGLVDKYRRAGQTLAQAQRKAREHLEQVGYSVPEILGRYELQLKQLRQSLAALSKVSVPVAAALAAAAVYAKTRPASVEVASLRTVPGGRDLISKEFDLAAIK